MRKCPLCNGIGSSLAFPYETKWKGKVFNYIKCQKCGTTFVNPIPDETDFAAMYAKENYHDVYTGRVDLETYKSSITKMMLYSKGHESLLDFGCGVGNFLKTAKQMGFRCHGVEYDPKVIEYAEENAGVPVYSLAELKKTEQKFDIIHLGDVLEHMADPKTLIRELSKLLTPQGVLFIEGPLQINPSLIYWVSSSFKAVKRKLGIDHPRNTAPTHLIMTNKRAQKLFFTDTLGYTCIHYEIYETGWPYLSKESGNMSLGTFVKHSMGKLAVIISKIELRKDKILGNRFLGIFQPNNRSGG